jgi:hypothetical protein
LLIWSDNLAIDLLLNYISNELTSLTDSLNRHVTRGFSDISLNLGSKFLSIHYSVKFFFVSSDSLSVYTLFVVVNQVSNVSLSIHALKVGEVAAYSDTVTCGYGSRFILLARDIFEILADASLLGRVFERLLD